MLRQATFSSHCDATKPAVQCETACQPCQPGPLCMLPCKTYLLYCSQDGAHNRMLHNACTLVTSKTLPHITSTAADSKVRTLVPLAQPLLLQYAWCSVAGGKGSKGATGKRSLFLLYMDAVSVVNQRAANDSCKDSAQLSQPMDHLPAHQATSFTLRDLHFIIKFAQVTSFSASAPPHGCDRPC